MRKHGRDDCPGMLEIPDQVAGQIQIADNGMKQFFGRIQEYVADQLKQHDSQEDRHIDDDQPGNGISRLKLVPYVVCYGFKHLIKVGLFEDNVQRPEKA